MPDPRNATVPTTPPTRADTAQSPRTATDPQPRRPAAQKRTKHRHAPWRPKSRVPRLNQPPPGTPAGIEYHELIQTPASRRGRVICTDYSQDQWEIQEVEDMAAFLALHRPEWSEVRWIHVEGIEDQNTIRALAEKYQLHPLAIEDALDGQQRPKTEDYPGSGDLPGRLFVAARRVLIQDGVLHAEQASFFLGRHTLLSFQVSPCQAIDQVRHRIESPRSRLRQNDASFLLYALLDTIVDCFYPVLEDASGQLEELEDNVLDHPQPHTLQSIHQIKRGLVLIRRVAWPMRELIAALQRERHECLSDAAQTYFRDVYDHCVQVIDLLETYREIASELADTYVSMTSHRTNQIMKVLTIIGTIFMPLTFLVGIYGMNMYIPENEWPYSYAVFWVVAITIAGVMLWRFRRGGWL